MDLECLLTMLTVKHWTLIGAVGKVIGRLLDAAREGQSGFITCSQRASSELAERKGQLSAFRACDS